MRITKKRDAGADNFELWCIGIFYTILILADVLGGAR